MKIVLSIVLLFWIGSVELSAQTLKDQLPVLITEEKFQVATQQAIDSLYNRNPQAARELIKPWSEAYPAHPFWQLWDAMEIWWQVLTDLYDHSHDDRLFRKMERADQAAIRLLRDNPQHADGHIIRAVANGYIARQNANRKRWIKSIRTARNAQKAHEQLGNVAPELADYFFAEGLKKYYAAYLPEAYPVVRAVSWLLPSGDRQEGLRLLELTSHEAVFARPESIYFLGVILLNYEQEYDRAVTHFQTLVENYPNNSYYRRLLVRTLYHQQKDMLAEEELARALDYWSRNGFVDEPVLKEELLYWRGRILMRYAKNEEALENFAGSYRIGQALPNTKNRSFHALSGYYAGIMAERTDDNVSARNYYQAVIQLECESEIRKRARERLQDL